MNDFLTLINDAMYTYVLLFLLVGIGIFYTIYTRAVQIRLLFDGLRAMIAPAKDAEKGGKKVSSFQALMISTASRVGTGNIAGIATAIVVGGSGAVFWMWVMAVIGAASAFAESTLAQIYKVKINGQFRGGPSYYMEKALKMRWMGVLFSVLLIICFAYGFNGLQAYNMTSALEYYLSDYSATMIPTIIKVGFGLILIGLTAFIIWGGAHRIGFISSVLVPIMSTGYILMGLIVSIIHITDLPEILMTIVRNAFDMESILGGIAGSAIVIGIKRGLFSNEAGMGSAPNASASADVAHPVQQGLVQVISVFIDTLLICSTTAMLLLVSGVEGIPNVLDGIPYVQAAISANVGEWGIHFITISIFAFAYSSVIGNYFYAESNILFIKDNKIVLNLFRITCLIAVFLGTQADFELAWNVADISMGLMAIVNIIAIFLLRKKVSATLKDYEKQKKEGKNPVFYEENIGVTDTVWIHEDKKTDLSK